VRGFNNIQENQPRTAASKRGPTATNAFEVGKKVSSVGGSSRHGFPRFKKKGALRSFNEPQLGTTFYQGNRFKLPVIGRIKFWQDRPIPQGAIVKKARVVRRSTGWYIMLTLQWDVSIPDSIPHGNPVGIDIKLTNFVATYKGLLIKRTRFFGLGRTQA